MQDIHLQNNEVQSSKIKKSLGLSNSPNLTARIYTKKYLNGEGSCRISLIGNSNCRINPPLQKGQRICNGISGRARRKIKLGCRMFQFYTKANNRVCGFITLTYGKDFPDDITAKRHLDNFLKRLHRLKGITYFLWVAEKQKRMAIHFHILTDFTEKEFINKAWNEIVQRWQSINGFTFQVVLPNVIGIYFPANYLSKYLSKCDQKILGNIYGMSHALRELTKPILEISNDVPYNYLLPVLEEALSTFSGIRYINNQGGQPRLIWAKEGIIELAGKIQDITNNIQHE